MSDSFHYAYLDGDDIGRQIELLMLDDHVNEAASYSFRVEEARRAVIKQLLQLDAIEVVFSGGDDILVSFVPGSVTDIDLDRARGVFASVCGQRMSVGVGETPNQAVGNLRRAKLAGKDRIVSRGVGWSSVVSHH